METAFDLPARAKQARQVNDILKRRFAGYALDDRDIDAVTFIGGVSNKSVNARLDSLNDPLANPYYLAAAIAIILKHPEVSWSSLESISAFFRSTSRADIFRFILDSQYHEISRTQLVANNYNNDYATIVLATIVRYVCMVIPVPQVRYISAPTIEPINILSPYYSMMQN